MKSRTDKGSSTAGSVALRLCFIAESTILRTLSLLKTFRSLLSPITGTILSTPSSVAFSANHSYLSLFFVGQTAMVNEYG